MAMGLSRLSLGLTRTGGGSASPLAAYAAPSGAAPVLVMDHAGETYSVDGASTTTFASAIDFLRSSTATYWDASLAMQTAAVDAARFDRLFSAREMLIEPARTNLQVHSAAIDNAAWGKLNGSVSADAVVAPDGTTTAERFIENTSNAKHQVHDGTGVTAAGASIFVKPNGRTFFGAYMGAFKSWNLTAVTGTGAGAVIHALGDGWYRCAATRTNTTDVYYGPATQTVTSDPTWEYTGDGSSGAYLWGAQLEADYPTSYIPTTAATASRSADDATVPTARYGHSATAGALTGTVRPLATPAAEMIFVRLWDGTANQRIEVYADASANIRFRVVDGGVTQCDIDSGVNAVGGTPFSFAARWAANNFAISVDGNAVVTDAAGTVPTVTELEYGLGRFSLIKQFATALSDSDIAAESA